MGGKVLNILIAMDDRFNPEVKGWCQSIDKSINHQSGSGAKNGAGAEVAVIEIPGAEMNMQSVNSNEKEFSSETSKEGGSHSIMTKMSSSVTQSSHTSSIKEFSSSTTSSSLVPGQPPTSVCVKTTKQSSELSKSENGGPPVVQVNK